MTSSELTTRLETAPVKFNKTYSKKEELLIKRVWVSAQAVAKNQMQLAFDLLDLKAEMDKKDPNASRGPGTSRFWDCFASGDLPEYVTKKRGTAHEWLQAAEYVRGNNLSGASDKLEALTPSTVCLIERIDKASDERPLALEIVKRHLKDHDFIGHDAASLLAVPSQTSGDDLELIYDWVKENPTMPLVPSAFRDLKKKRAELQDELDALQSKAYVDPEEEAEKTERFQAMLRDTATRNKSQSAAKAKAKEIAAVTNEIEREEKKRNARLEEIVEDYNSNLNATWKALKNLHACLQTVSAVDGTEVLDEARTMMVRGWLTINNDIERLQTISGLLVETVKLAQSSNPPTGLSVETIIDNMKEGFNDQVD